MSVNIVRWLVCTLLVLAGTQAYAQVELRDQLSKAIRKADPVAVRALLDAGASASARDSHGFAPLVTAVLVGARDEKAGAALEMAKILLDAGADINQEGPSGNAPLAVACSQTNSPDIVAFLIAHGADLNRRGYNATTPLYQAVRTKRSAIAEILVKHGADVKARNASGATPLHHAALNGMNGTAALLLSRGAQVNARDVEGKTPLSWAQGKLPRDFIGSAAPVPDMLALLRQQGGTE